MLKLSNYVSIPAQELEFSAIRAQGSGGQNVNKVSTAIHLRFDVNNSTLPVFYKQRLLQLTDQRINKEGIVVIKAQNFRSQEKNRVDALTRLAELIQKATAVNKTRRPTKVTKGSQQKRMDKKSQRGKTKALRGKPMD